MAQTKNRGLCACGQPPRYRVLWIRKKPDLPVDGEQAQDDKAARREGHRRNFLSS
jgi:hypothetical protein